MPENSLMRSLGDVSARSTCLIIPGQSLEIKQGWEISSCPFFPNLKPQDKAAVSVAILIEYFQRQKIFVEVISRDPCPGDLRIVHSGVERLVEVKVGVETFKRGPAGLSSSFWFNQIRDDGCHDVILVFATPSHFVSYQFTREAIRRLSSFDNGHVGADGLFEVKAVFNSRTCSLGELNAHGRMIDVVRY
jgi:hypothetical protein